MTVKDLIEELQTYPKDLIVGVSDGGYCEGATPLTYTEKLVAWEADLDGDAVSDEYTYIEKGQISDYIESHKIIHLNGEFIASKYILMINGEY